jgi:hypothetical protein
METTKCPRCGRKIKLQPHPEKPGRLIGNCECNPLGPVIETNAAPKIKGETGLAKERDE